MNYSQRKLIAKKLDAILEDLNLDNSAKLGKENIRLMQAKKLIYCAARIIAKGDKKL